MKSININSPTEKKYIYAYDDFGNLTLEERYTWDLSKKVWIGKSNTFNATYKSVYKYNSTGKLKTSFSGYIWAAIGDWVIYSRTIYNNKDLATDIKDKKVEPGIHLFPNPSNGYLTITNLESNSRVAIYSIIGVLIKEVYPQESRITIDITNLPSGIYMVKAGGNTHEIIKN